MQHGGANFKEGPKRPKREANGAEEFIGGGLLEVGAGERVLIGSEQRMEGSLLP